MANKLAGQKAKFTKARKIYYSTDDEMEKDAAIACMAQVLRWARSARVSEAEITQGFEFPEAARRASQDPGQQDDITDDDAEQLVEDIARTVDRSNVREIGEGTQCVYAYGYRCAPGMLKVGRCDGDVVIRITNQINASTPDKPILSLLMRTDVCRGLEKAVHGVLQVRGRKQHGGGDEWFQTDIAELVQIYEFVTGSYPHGDDPAS